MRPVIGYIGAPDGDRLVGALTSLIIRLSGGKPARLRRPPDDNSPRIDGLILLGGLDIHPSRYNAEMEVESRFDLQRDELELAWLAVAFPASRWTYCRTRFLPVSLVLEHFGSTASTGAPYAISRRVSRQRRAVRMAVSRQSRHKRAHCASGFSFTRSSCCTAQTCAACSAALCKPAAHGCRRIIETCWRRVRLPF